MRDGEFDKWLASAPGALRAFDARRRQVDGWAPPPAAIGRRLAVTHRTLADVIGRVQEHTRQLERLLTQAAAGRVLDPSRKDGEYDWAVPDVINHLPAMDAARESLARFVSDAARVAAARDAHAAEVAAEAAHAEAARAAEQDGS